MARSRDRKALYLEVASSMEAAIQSGEWTSGQRLPSLAELATYFSVSRTVVREACGVLVGAGLLELRHGDGTYVRELPLDAVIRPMHAALLLNPADLRDLLEVDAWIEQGIAVAAAARRREEQCRAMAQALLEMESALGQAEAVWEAERRFHGLLAEASGNRTAENLLRVMYHPLSSLLVYVGEDAGFQAEAVSLHRGLLDSVIRMDGDAAARHASLYRGAIRERALALRERPIRPGEGRVAPHAAADGGQADREETSGK